MRRIFSGTVRSAQQAFVRDYLDTLDWNESATGPIVPRRDRSVGGDVP